MNKISKLSITLGVALIALGGTAFADTYEDIQTPNANISPIFGSYTGLFNIVSPGSQGPITISGYPSGDGTYTDAGGYVLGTPLDSATASFFVTDTSNRKKDEVDVVLWAFGLPSGTFDTTSKSWSADVVIDGDNAVLNVLDTFGALAYTVSSADGTFVLDDALLVASTANSQGLGGNPVPDSGSTALLLGGVFSAIGLLKRHKKF